ncbi:Os11g0659700 [Oryza sativa Japonica Group]|uniref:pectinesterase n=1 Tax=Oryza sativa subsp. japonica TaxID=39947 RepID=A0A0N7KTB2_ORYSJ|nr:Os11g0659700 [Oryza sativa Japonica Group]
MMMTRKSLLFLQLGLLVAASLPPASKQMEVSLKKWLADNQLLYTTPDAEDTAMDAGVVAASKAQVHVGVDPAGSGSGGGKRRTIAAALAGVPDSGGGEPKSYELSLKPGQVFREKVVVGKGKAYVTLKSDPANPAVIVWNDTAATLGKDGEPLGHVRSATLTVEADNFVASGVVIKNDAPSGLEGGKTVALRVAGTKASFFKCTIEAGGQGAVYVRRRRAALLQGVHHQRRRRRHLRFREYSTTQAQAQRAPKYDGLDGTTNPAFLGFSFHNCTIEAGAGDSGGADDKVYLGRAWDDSSFVVFSNTMMARLCLLASKAKKSKSQQKGAGTIMACTSALGLVWKQARRWAGPKSSLMASPMPTKNLSRVKRGSCPHPRPRTDLGCFEITLRNLLQF